MTIEAENYGEMPDGRGITRYILRNDNGVEIGLIDFGAIVESILVPDRHGERADVALGFDDLKGWVERNAPYFGATVGRCANRIGNGRFSIDGQRYQLAVNNGPNCLHGGIVGFDKKVWQSQALETEDGPAVVMNLHSPDGDENFPGNLDCTVTFTLKDGNSLAIDYEATADKPTIVNLTNHSYFNLGGHDSGHIGDHIFQIDADNYTPNDQYTLPVGTIEALDGLAIDLREPCRIGDRLDSLDGFDHNYALNSRGDLSKPVAIVSHPASGRVLEVFTTEPGLQLYTADYLDGIEGKNGTSYQNQDAFCLEAQRFPDAVNHDNFPNVILRPGETYRQTTIYRFPRSEA